AVQQKLPTDVQRVADLQFDLEVMIAQKPGSQSAVAAPPPAAVPAPVVSLPDLPANGELGTHRWRVDFRGLPQLFVHGNDPLRMLRELSELGRLESSVDFGQLPKLSDLNPENCYLSWQLFLTSEVTREVVASVFDWAEGDCELKIAGHVPQFAAAHKQEAATARVSGSNDPVVEVVRATAGGDSSSIRVSIEKIDELMNAVGELVITQSMLSQVGAREANGNAVLRAGLLQLERNVRELQENVMRVRMLPISFVFSRFPRMVRDLSQRLGKQVELKVTGDQTELDKTVMERIGDPLTHLVRNCVDHGIEKPDVRIAAGKSPIGTVHLEAYHKGGSIIVEVSDDGGGLNKQKILEKARARDLIGATDTLTDEQVYDLVFMAGFSTADQTTDISGRGVGMDVVRRNVKELGGNIELRSEAGLGSRFIINLPLTLAIVDGQSVSVGSETYIVPLTTIVESLQLKPSMINNVVGHGEVCSFREEYVPIIRLHEIFGVQPRTHELHEGLLMIVEGEGRRVGLFVDDLLGQQQVVIKSLETNYRHVSGVSGATILGDGSVALILDVPGLIRVAADRQAA
ncbi:MAG TPA: chemotaxis protein CheA, partial [Steroidobacteraceae bacterium]|nr:chemotaxis protein CheA [Steroidobacteraceae bacterium]